MGQVIITLRLMPEDLEVDLNSLKIEVLKKIEHYCGNNEIRSEEEQIAFGLVALKFTFIVDESRGGTYNLEEDIKKLEGVNSLEVIDVRRVL